MEQNVRAEMAQRIDDAVATGMHAVCKQSCDEMARLWDPRVAIVWRA